MRLTPRHLLFVENYCNPESHTFGNAYRSYIKSGFKDGKTAIKNACQLISKTDIRKQIDLKNKEYKEKRAEKCDFDEEFIRTHWLKLLDDCIAANDRTNANTALRAMAQHKAMLTDKFKDETEKDVKPLPEQLLSDYREVAKNILFSQKTG